VADIDGIKPVYPTLPARRIDKDAPQRDKGRQEQPPVRPPRDRQDGDEDKPQVDEYV